jgi:transposase InsO family protein
MELWIKMRRNNYVISLSSVLRILKKSKEYTPYISNAKKKHDKHYHTPTMIGVKWQMDVKFVPQECKSPSIISKNFYQYTVLDECSRKRFLYFTNEHSMYESSIALRKAIKYFGYSPLILQTDNGWEFSECAQRNKKAPHARKYPNILEVVCTEFGIIHKFIRPRTPEHNGKVERSHRIDQDKFYRTLRFYSLEDLRTQGKAWNKKYNNTPRYVLKCKAPEEIEIELKEEFLKIRSEQGQRNLTSFDS